MQNKSIGSYNVPERVASYDARMDVMHPNREKMIQIALEILPFDENTSFTALELGTGTGYFTKKFLESFPDARIIAVEGASAMVAGAKERLGKLAAKVDFRIGDFRELGGILSGGEMGRVVFSSYALHHLSAEEKRTVLRQAKDFLEPGGWFINADLISSENAMTEELIQKLRVEGIVRRAGGVYPEFRDTASTRKFLDELEKSEGDRPLTAAGDLNIIRGAGFYAPAVFWLEYGEAVFGAVK